MRAQGQLVICGACGKALEIVTTGNVVRCNQRAARKPVIKPESRVVQAWERGPAVRLS
jgi:DNA-directed RNA polymerase subunit RPC12/RpoP